MEFKNTFKVFSILTLLVLSLSLISALSLTTSADLTSGSNQSTFVLKNTNNVTQNVTISIGDIVSGSSVVDLSINPTNVNSLTAGSSQTITALINSIVGSFSFGKYSSTISASGIDADTGVAVSNATASVSFVKSFCKSGSIGGNLEITAVDINSDGDEDLEWKPLDTLTVDVDVDNNGADDIKEVTIEIALFDSNGRNKINDVDFISSDEDKVSLGTIKDGDGDKTTFEFRIPADFSDGSYSLAVKAYSDKLGEAKECTDTSDDFDSVFFESVDIIKEDDSGKYIAFDNIQIDPETATCGDTALLSFDAFNIGDEDQDRVRVTVQSKELNLDQLFEIKSGLDQGDNQVASFTFQVPSGLADKTYQVRLNADYDYRNGNYRESLDDDTLVPLKVIGCIPSSSSGKLSNINAALESNAKAGSELVVRSTITNLDSKTNTFTISALGFESWADLESISPRQVTLKAGESQDVTIKLNVNDDTFGDNSFTIESKSGDKVDSRELSVSLAESQSQLSNLFKGNSLIWVVAIINVILIVLIIIVAIRISRKD